MDELDCSDNELATFVDKTITLRRHPTQEDVNATTNTGIVRHKSFIIGIDHKECVMRTQLLVY